MPTMTRAKAAVYVKGAAGYPGGEDSRELQLHHCMEFCKFHDLDIVARYHEPNGLCKDFDRMMGEATKDEPPFGFIVVYKLRNFSWLLEETVVRRDRLGANGVNLVQETESTA